MTRRLFGVRAFALVAALAPLAAAVPAAADPPDTTRFAGGCRSVSVNPQRDDGWVGTVDAFVVGYSVWHEHAPVTVERVRCWLRIDGVPSGVEVETTGTGPVAVIPPTPIAYRADPDSVVDVCETVEVVDAHGTGKVWSRCEHGDPALDPVHPAVKDAHAYYLQPVLCPYGVACDDPDWRDVVDDVFAVAGDAFRTVDPAVCAVLRDRAPDLPGYVTTDDEGDVYVLGELWWDCPPYQPL